MDCRTKENPERTFDLVLKVKCHASENEDPVVLWKFPEDFGDQEVLQSVPKFCFPFDIERVSQNQVGQHFTFVLTDIESKQRFGFCRLTSGGKICLCILSYLPWFEVYYKLLNTLADYLAKELENDLNETLKSLYNHPVPKANTPVNLSVHSYFIAPDVTGLPTIPESRNLTEYFVAVDVNNMLQLYASMLHERRVIITSSKLSTLTACLHGSVALLYPMYWQHIYIPVLPPHLLDYCCAPMPYLIGIHSSLIERVKNKSLEDVVMLNVDTNTLESPFNDLNNLPSDVVSALKNKLKKQSTATGDGVARAFLRAQAALFGSYRDALRYKPGEPITFCEESFVKHRSSLMKQFLETAVNLQLFKQFIDGRLAKLNAGRGFSDVFEEEITSGGFCGGNPRSYQQWVHTVKRGGALFNTAMTKATPAVRTAYKFAKNHAKQGIKEVKSKLKHKENEEDYGTCSGSVQYTPVYTLHNEKGGNLEKRKLAQGRLKRPLKSLDSALYDDDHDERASKLSSEDGEEASADFYESDDSVEARVKTPYSGEMDLLGEILDTLSTHSSDQGKLAAAKSLDFFRSMDDIDYKPTNKSNAPSENNLTLLCSGSGDQVEWHLGQDDSALHGKHLPPSPRKRVPSSGWTDSLFILKEENNEKHLSVDNVRGPAVTEKAASASELDFQLASPEVSEDEKCKTERKETLSQISDDLLIPSLGRHSSTFVPWEKEGKEAKETSEDSGLLHEVVSLCHITSAFQQDLNISEENTSGNQT
ncbi:DENN domain-containing protein 1B isoform X3 [Leopardus geoffroyi]|uniref:DENN domain containing 1B n=2 Tax=Felidae TaxID=9681 RepID=A0A8C9D756_PANLE|nr:DENN domain-containing protein 1B isoform X2 [Lynx canadensis]XP_042781647.1 DENN domain-containing protein 1B isoform X2 [Panthera leo]XP_042832403.1 DENN domain-containing protein 1B isoform X2 [Panthera tigris]XP_045312620.1 DENN domain-containing protein 1B isoform X3 [Leopardus geoffroyi]XP_046932682.1 DENN domain-containing protein 1B isoform X2 [Lynx rufus]XP_049490256.1 DENN domain-containing protein 1B isoform X2 [Panthera uncia]